MTAIDLEQVSNVAAIKALIQAFFDSINAADTKALQSHFFPSAGLTIIRQDPPLDPSSSSSSSPLPSAGDQNNNNNNNNNNDDHATEVKEKLTVVLRTTIETFVKLIEDGQKKGRPPGDEAPVIHEAADLDATEVRVDALFAMAWAPFRVSFDGVLHHYGTMVYTLGRCDVGGGGGDNVDRAEWKIEGLTQNYRRTPGWDAME